MPTPTLKCSSVRPGRSSAASGPRIESIRWCIRRRETSLSRTHAAEPFGRSGRRTRYQASPPGRFAPSINIGRTIGWVCVSSSKVASASSGASTRGSRGPPGPPGRRRPREGAWVVGNVDACRPARDRDRLVGTAATSAGLEVHGQGQARGHGKQASAERRSSFPAVTTVLVIDGRSFSLHVYRHLLSVGAREGPLGRPIVGASADSARRLTPAPFSANWPELLCPLTIKLEEVTAVGEAKVPTNKTTMKSTKSRKARCEEDHGQRTASSKATAKTGVLKKVMAKKGNDEIPRGHLVVRGRRP